MRRILLTAVVLGAVLAPMPAAQARATLTCNSADLRFPLRPNGPRSFGVFNLAITGGTCSTARRVAREWAALYEASIITGKSKAPRRAGGFSFTTLPATRAQQLRERGRKGSTSIRFDYRIPNG